MTWAKTGIFPRAKKFLRAKGAPNALFQDISWVYKLGFSPRRKKIPENRAMPGANFK